MNPSVPALLDRLIPSGPTDPPGLRATNWLLTHGLPDPHDEAWRYAPVTQILERLTTYEPARPRPITRADIDRLAGAHGPNRVVLVNGKYTPELSDLDTNTTGTWIGRLSELAHGDTAAPPSVNRGFADGFHALNQAASSDPAVVIVEAGAGHDAHLGAPAPIHIVHVIVPGATPEISHPRTVIEVGDWGRLHLIETFTGLAGAALTNACTTVRLGRAASLTHHRVQTETPGTTHIGHTQVVQAEESRYETSSLMFGGDIARHAIDVTLREPDAHVTLTGLYRPTGRQRHDLAVSVDHAASRGTSTQRFKGVVDDHARGSFSGRVIVRADTVGNDARQSNPNLVLQPTAQADSRPWLEIFADEVRCTHGATVGRLDDDALFYLRSRGIPLDESRAMLIDAFVREITELIEPASLRHHITGLFGIAAQEREP